MPWMFPEWFFIVNQGEGEPMRCSNLDLITYAGIELSGRRPTEDGTLLTNVGVQETLWVILDMATLVTH